VIVGQEGAVADDEVAERRYLLEVGWDVRVIALGVHIVELQNDHVLDPVWQRARAGRERGAG